MSGATPSPSNRVGCGEQILAQARTRKVEERRATILDQAKKDELPSKKQKEEIALFSQHRREFR
jgi:hypothetical protein